MPLFCVISPKSRIWQGKFTQAIRNTEKALQLSRNTMFRSGEAHAHLSLGMVMNPLGLYERAIPHVSECLRISKEAGLSDYRIPCQYLFAQVHRQINNHKASEKHIIDGILLCEEGDPERHLPSLRALRAQLLILLGNPQEAQQIIQFVEEEARDLPWPRRLETMLSIAHARSFSIKRNRPKLLLDLSTNMPSKEAYGKHQSHRSNCF